MEKFVADCLGAQVSRLGPSARPKPKDLFQTMNCQEDNLAATSALSEEELSQVLMSSYTFDTELMRMTMTTLTFTL